MHKLSRRKFVATSTVAGLGICNPARNGRAVVPFSRKTPNIRGLSLATYSLKRHMNWWRGKLTDGKLDMLGFLEYCARLGFDAAELTAYFFEAPLTQVAINQLKRRAHLLGLDISGGAIGNDFGHPPASDVGQQQLEYAKTWIDHYADLGAPAIRVFASRSRPDGATDKQLVANVIANLEKTLPHAEKRGVMLGIENHDFATNLDHLLDILSGIDSDWLGVTWDSANLALTANPYDDLARIAPYAITAQLKVTTRVNGAPVQADYGRLINILRAAKYRGYLVLEYEESEDPYVQIPQFAADVRTALEATIEP